MSAYTARQFGPYVLSVNISPGGIPKRPIASAMAMKDGLQGDGHNHAKHVRPDRAVSLWDYEMLRVFAAEGFSLTPGAAGENLTVVNLNILALSPGTLLQVGQAILKLEQSRKPCYVLDAIDPRLKDAVVGRFGFMASVIRTGVIQPGMPITVFSAADVDSGPTKTTVIPAVDAIRALPGTRSYHLLAGPTIG